MTVAAVEDTTLEGQIAAAILEELSDKLDRKPRFETPEAVVHRAAVFIAQIIPASSDKALPFRRVGHVRTRKELRQLIKAKGRIKEVETAVTALHASAIECLSDVGWTRKDLIENPSHATLAAKSALLVLKDNKDVLPLDMKPRNLKIIAVTKTLAHLYEELTNGDATWDEAGRFLRFLSILQPLIYDEALNLEGYARVAILERRKSKGNFL